MSKFLFAFNILVNISFSSLLLLPETEVTDKCLKTSLDTVITKRSNNLLISTNNSESFATYFNFNKIVVRTTTNELEWFLSDLNFKPLNYLIILDDKDLINTTLQTIFNSPVFSSYSKLFIFTQETHLKMNLANLLWDLKLANSFIIYKNGKLLEINRLIIKKCGSVVEIENLLSNNRNNCIFSTTVDLKTTFNGCPLYVINVDNAPFTFYIGNDTTGIFYELMIAFGHVSRRKVIFRPHNPVYMKEIEDFYNYGSVIEDFESGYAEIFIGPGTISLIEIFDVSPIFMQDNLIMLVPRAVLRYIDILLLSGLHFEIAFYIVTLSLVVIFFYLVVRRTIDKRIFNSAVKSLLLFFGLSINVSTLPKLPVRQHIRILLGRYMKKNLPSPTKIFNLFDSKNTSHKTIGLEGIYQIET